MTWSWSVFIRRLFCLLRMKKIYLPLSRTGRFRLPHASMKYQPAGKTELGSQLKRLLYCSIESGRPQNQSPGKRNDGGDISLCNLFLYSFCRSSRFCLLPVFISSSLMLYVFSPSHILILSALFYPCLPFIFNFLQFSRCENVPYYLLQFSLALSLWGWLEIIL